MLSQRLLEFSGVFVFSLLIKLRERLKLIEVEKVNAELAYLKAQINPHFLFNTLNSIYSLALTNNNKTAESIVKLADMMRYVLNESNFEEVLVVKEKEYIFNFIELQILRLSPSVKLSCSWEGSADHLKISPLIIIPFIENAFKHGVNSEEDSEISMHVSIIDTELKLQIKNKIVTESNATLDKSGIGIATTKRRLELLYPEKHTLSCVEKNGWYCVDLKIRLND
jgi:LytS/YehU family sensor histidine kinase